MSESGETSSGAGRRSVTTVVVLALFVVIVSLIGPAFQSPRGPHYGLQNLSNLHQIGIAITNYATVSNGLLPANHGLHSWRVAVCPVLDRQDIYRAYDFEARWDAPGNEKFTKQLIPVMKSPFRPDRLDERGRGYTDYGLISGPGTVNPPEGPVTLDFISEHDGLGQTLLVGECSGLQLIWTEPRDPDVSRETIRVATVSSSKPVSDALVSSYAPYGVCALFADGSGKQLSKEIDHTVLAAICTVAGAEDIRPDQINR